MVLQQDRLIIRNASAADAQTLCAWWNDGAVMAHAGFPNGLGTTQKDVAAQLAADTDQTRRRLILALDARPIGEMSYTIDGKTAEIGIKICDAQKQEHGYGRVALSMLIKALFSMGMEEIVLDTNLDNTRAHHVYELLGFRRVGVRYDAWRDQLGRLQSQVDYALRREDFCDFSK